MADKISNGHIVQGKGNEIITAVIYSASSGTAKVQALCGNDVDSDNWVDIPDSEVSASSVYSFHAAQGHKYKFVLTGDAVVYI